MNRLFSFFLLGFIFVLANSPSLYAYSRGKLPFYVAFMQAESIAIVQVTDVVKSGGSFRDYFKIDFNVLSVLKGEVSPELNTTFLHAFYEVDIGQLESGEKYIFFFDNDRVMLDGTSIYSEENKLQVVDWLSRISKWPEPIDGLSILPVPNHYSLPEDKELDLYFLIKNVSADTINLKYHNLPIEQNTHWKLNITSSNGDIVKPLPHPYLTEKSFKEYESTQEFSYDMVIKPGKFAMFTIKSINMALSGFGYKEKLNFQYYPLPPGTYKISGQGYEFHNEKILESGSVQITIQNSCVGTEGTDREHCH